MTPCVLTFDNVGHESALDDEPYAPGNVEGDGLRAEKDGDPLVVAVVQPRPVVLPPRAHTLEVGRDVEAAVHPAERVQHVVVHRVLGLFVGDKERRKLEQADNITNVVRVQQARPPPPTAANVAVCTFC